MNNATAQILERLAGADFEYPVAIYVGTDFDLGAVTEVDAFDVGERRAVEVSQRLAVLLWGIDETPMLLPGVIHDFESADKRAELPADTIWFTPRRRAPTYA